MKTQDPRSQSLVIRRKWLAVSLLTSVMAVPIAFAQTPMPQADATVATPDASVDAIKAMISNSPASSLLAVDRNRGAIIETIVNQWRAEIAAGSDAATTEAQLGELRSSLRKLRADNLLAASVARTYEGVKQVFAEADAVAKFTSNDAQKKDGQKELGLQINDTVYTPIVPCKLVDTRTYTGNPASNAGGGAFAASAKRTYNSFTGCGPTPSNMTALMVAAATQYTGAGQGILSLMKVGDPGPVTNIFGSGYASITTVVPVNGGSGASFDAQISGVAGTDLLVDVIGYFARPIATALECVDGTFDNPAVAAGFNSFIYWTGSCGVGKVITANNCYNNGNTDIYSMGQGTNGGAWCAFRNLGVAATVRIGAKCCGVPGR